jgi:phosphohistidine swiveling domain-containing protein
LILKAISNGSRPFSFIARQAFVAESLLRSLQTRGALSADRINQFRSSLPTITRRLSIDQKHFISGSLPPDLFYSRYGHLRPNSFDINSPCYRNRHWPRKIEKPPENVRQTQSFLLTGPERRALSQLLTEHQYDNLNPEGLIEFIANAICGREESKFIFSAFLSDLLETISEWGELYDLSRDDLSYLSLDDIQKAMNRKSVADQMLSLANIIQRAKKRYKDETNLLLNPLISTINDVDYFWHIDNTPHFIGRSAVEAKTHRIDHTTASKTVLHNRIVLIECADPGFDWIFTQEISGLITAYGGPNSHMAVRSAEFGIPAALGCGEMLFQRLATMNYIGIDCINKRLYTPDSAMPLSAGRSDRCG